MADCVTGQLGNDDGALRFPPGGMRPHLLGRATMPGAMFSDIHEKGEHRHRGLSLSMAFIDGEWEAFAVVTSREGYLVAEHDISVNVYKVMRVTVNDNNPASILQSGGSLVWSIGAGGLADSTITRYQPFTQVDLPIIEGDDDSAVITRLHDGDRIWAAGSNMAYSVTDNPFDNMAEVRWPTSIVEVWGWPVND